MNTGLKCRQSLKPRAGLVSNDIRICDALKIMQGKQNIAFLFLL